MDCGLDVLRMSSQGAEDNGAEGRLETCWLPVPRKARK